MDEDGKKYTKDNVLVCLTSDWHPCAEVCAEMAFCHKLNHGERHAVTMIVVLQQLQINGLVEIDIPPTKNKPINYRLTEAGVAKYNEIMSANPELARAHEDFLFAGVPI